MGGVVRAINISGQFGESMYPLEIRARRSLAPPGSWEAPFRFSACIGTMIHPLTRPSGTLSPSEGERDGVRRRVMESLDDSRITPRDHEPERSRGRPRNQGD